MMTNRFYLISHFLLFVSFAHFNVCLIDFLFNNWAFKWILLLVVLLTFVDVLNSWLLVVGWLVLVVWLAEYAGWNFFIDFTVSLFGIGTFHWRGTLQYWLIILKSVFSDQIWVLTLLRALSRLFWHWFSFFKLGILAFAIVAWFLLGNIFTLLGIVSLFASKGILLRFVLITGILENLWLFIWIVILATLIGSSIFNYYMVWFDWFVSNDHRLD